MRSFNILFARLGMALQWMMLSPLYVVGVFIYILMRPITEGWHDAQNVFGMFYDKSREKL